MQLLKALFGCTLAASPFWLAACSDTASEVGRLDSPVDNQECSTPGETLPAADGCNDCTCADGKWACTDKACGGDQSCLYEGKEYADGESWQCDCNTCFCEDGQVGGTLIGCEPGPEPECEPGATKTADDGCNECSCADGQWACTDKACTPDPSNCAYDGTTYESGDMFRCGECGICFCVEGSVGHSDAACDLPPTGAGCTFADTQYPHGEIFDCDCNVCWCDNGQVGGNIRACEAEPGGGASCTVDGVVYEDGQTFPSADGCNHCFCVDGQSACTLRACDICSLSADSGPCFAAMTKFYFDAQTGECLPFTYGGCQGNANRFDTLEACEQACPGGI